MRNNTMKKYVIFAIPRTGSTHYAVLIDVYYRETLDNYFTDMYSSCHDKIADWNHAIQHTHQIELFSTAPDDFIKILPTRSLLDSVVSQSVAESTDIWHIISDKDRSMYCDKFQNKKVKIDLRNFQDLVLYYDNAYSRAFEIIDKHAGEKYILEYGTHALDYQKFFSTLGINFDIPDNFEVNYQMPIDKFALVDNLQEILDLYESLPIIHDFNDSATIAHAKTFLRKPI